MSESATNAQVAQAPGMRTATFPFETNALSPEAATSPCKLKGTWYFKGSCIKANVGKTGTTFSLKAYKGFTMALKTGTTDATKAVSLIVGNGTGSSDITGTNGGTKFPFMVSNNCVKVKGSQGQLVPCPKPFAYVEVVNVTKTGIDFNNWPSFTIANTNKYPGKTCSLDVLVGTQSGALYWDLLPITGKVKGQKLTIPAKKAASGGISPDAGSGSIILYAIGCK